MSTPWIFQNRTEHYEGGESYTYRWFECQPFWRFVLARFSFLSKAWADDHKRLTRLRALYWTLIRGHESEICERCGGPVRLVFHVPDRIWEEVTGFARFPDGEAAPGCLCPQCVDDRFSERGTRGFLRWTCFDDDSVMQG